MLFRSGYWRASKNTKRKKEKSKRPEKIKTVTVTKEGPLTKQQFGKITLNTIRLARNLSALPTIAKEVSQLKKNLKTLSESKSFSQGKQKGKNLGLSKILDNASTAAAVATLGAYAATDTTEQPKQQEYEKSVYDTKSLEEQAAEEREAYSQGSNQQPVPVTPPAPPPVEIGRAHV